MGRLTRLKTRLRFAVISQRDVSRISGMSRMFYSGKLFSSKISIWDVLRYKFEDVSRVCIEGGVMMEDKGVA